MKILNVLFILIIVGCGNYPKDAAGTLNHVINNELKVGFARAQTRKGIEPVGKVAEIVKGYSNHIKARLHWVKGSEGDLVELLKNREIDMAIVGFLKNSAYKKEVAFTRSCYVEKIKVGASSLPAIPANIEGRKVYVSNAWTAMYVKEKNGEAVMTDSLGSEDGLVAGSEEEIKRKNFQVSKYDLHKNEYVIAIAKGENAFLMDLEKFIDNYGKW